MAGLMKSVPFEEETTSVESHCSSPAECKLPKAQSGTTLSRAVSSQKRRHIATRRLPTRFHRRNRETSSDESRKEES